MDFIEELSWRGILHDMTPGVEEALQNGPVTAYIGFDPTAPSMTIGNYLQLMTLTLFQRSGHRPIVLMGGATGRIGDPSGRDTERSLMSYELIDRNLAHQRRQVEQLLDFDAGEQSAMLLNNYDFYQGMSVLDFLRDVGKTLTINYMLSKDSVKNRLESGLSFTEFSYQLLQAFDFQHLYQHYNCILQMGGSDQWGNITSGTEFIRRNLGEKAYGITTKLLTKSDGTKFGKSQQGNLWLDPELTSPYQFYQFWINADDADLPKYIRYFTLKSREEVEAMEAAHADDPRKLKQMLAEELTVRIHGEEEYEAVQRVSNLLFNKRANREELLGLNATTLAAVAREIPSFQVSANLLQTGVNVTDLLAEHTEIVASKAEARRSIKGNALAVNKEKVGDFEQMISPDDLLHGRYLMIENGKKNKYMVEVV